MNVGQLKKLLDNYCDEAEIVVEVYSDYGPLNEVKVVEAVDQGQYIMRAHSSMSVEFKQRAKRYLLLSNNGTTN